MSHLFITGKNTLILLHLSSEQIYLLWFAGKKKKSLVIDTSRKFRKFITTFYRSALRVGRSWRRSFLALLLPGNLFHFPHLRAKEEMKLLFQGLVLRYYQHSYL